MVSEVVATCSRGCEKTMNLVGRGIDCIDYVTGIGNLHMRSTGTRCYGYQPSNG